MRTIVIRSDSTLVNPPANTPVFSAIPFTPIVDFSAGRLQGLVGSDINLPLNLNGSAATVLDSTGSALAPKLKEQAGVKYLEFNGVNGLRQTAPLVLNSGFTVAIVFKAASYTNQTNSRLIALGSSENNRHYININSAGIAIAAGANVNGYTDSSKKIDNQCVVVKFDGVDSRYINGATVQSISLDSVTSETTSYLSLGTRLASSVDDALIADIAAFRIYQEDLNDTQLMDVYSEMTGMYM